MRILTLTNLYPNPYQPQRGTFNRQQLRGLAAAHQVRVISPLAWTDELPARWRTGTRMPCGRRSKLDGISVEYPQYFYPPKCFRACYGDCYAACVRPTFNRLLADSRPDIIYAPWTYPDGWAAVQLGHAAGLPVVIKVHGSDFLLLDEYPARRGRTLEALKAADGIIAVSADLRRRMIQAGIDGSKIEVIYDGVDRDMFCPGSCDEARTQLGVASAARVILFIGNLVKVKGIDVLIEAFGLLQSDCPDAICYLIGHGKLRRSLERQIKKKQLGAKIRLLGGRPHAELPNWYRAADLFVLPSHSEGVPCVLLEAAACGTPFVASSVGGIPEISHLGSNRLVPPGDPQMLRDAMQQMLSDPLPSQSTNTECVRDMSAAVAQIENCLLRVLSGQRGIADHDGEAVNLDQFSPAQCSRADSALVSSSNITD